MTQAIPFVFLIGFDRSGSSMLAKLLAKHPKVNLIFQPFNNTEITRHQWKVWGKQKKSKATEAFLQKLTKGFIDENYIQSDWFYNHSSSNTIKPEQINLIKDTKLHFKVTWLQYNFPEFDIYGIWRDPRGILCSLVRNNFHYEWYGHITVSLLRGIINKHSIFKHYRRFVQSEIDQLNKMAVGMALRIHYMLHYTPMSNWFIYEEILKAPNIQLNDFVTKFNSSHFPFAKHISENFNVQGEKFRKSTLWTEYFSKKQLHHINNIFAPLLKFQSRLKNEVI